MYVAKVLKLWTFFSMLKIGEGSGGPIAREDIQSRIVSKCSVCLKDMCPTITLPWEYGYCFRLHKNDENIASEDFSSCKAIVLNEQKQRLSIEIPLDCDVDKLIERQSDEAITLSEACENGLEQMPISEMDVNGGGNAEILMCQQHTSRRRDEEFVASSLAFFADAKSLKCISFSSFTNNTQD